MSERIDPAAGQPAPPERLVDVPRLVSAYYTEQPDPADPEQRVAFGTSGHRGVSTRASFNEAHVLAITQAICDYRRAQGVDGPLYIGFDTHALSAPAYASALEVLVANGVHVRSAKNEEYTPTPAISHAILRHNEGRSAALADGIVITPSHNPPDSGGFKYNPTNGGPADTAVTAWMEARANELLEQRLAGVRRVALRAARGAPLIEDFDFLGQYVAELERVIDFEAIRAAGLRLAVDPLGGAGVHYWPRIAEVHRLDLRIVNESVDPTFRFMTLDWDGKIRMDPSSPYAMQRLLALRARYDVAFACDTDHDRHGIVTPSAGLLPANHYLAAAIDYLYRHRGGWRADAAVGKTAVSSAMIDRVAQRLGRRLYEVPVGFKWFVAGLLSGELGFGGEESAGASFATLDGRAWSTDKDGIIAALLAAEMTARMRCDPGEAYRGLERDLGATFIDRLEAAVTPAQKRRLARLDRSQVRSTELAGEPIEQILTHAPGNGAPLGGLKVCARGGWFAARPSGTEDIYKLYAESLRDAAHLQQILREAQLIVDAALAGG